MTDELNELPKVSCVMLTHPPKFKYAEQAVSMFMRQTLAQCELVVVHRNDQEFDEQLRKLVVGLNAKVIQCPEDTTIGGMRQIGADSASNDLIATWDDDDLHHPDRLLQQVRLLVKENTTVCFVGDYVHGFDGGIWKILHKWDPRLRGLRGSMVENSMVYNRRAYPDVKWPLLPKGEDTGFIDQLMAKIANSPRRGFSFVVYQPWLFGYRATPQGICSSAHHQSLLNSMTDVHMSSVLGSGGGFNLEFGAILHGIHRFDYGGQIWTVKFPSGEIISKKGK